MRLRTASPEDAERLVEIYRPYIEQTAVSYEYIVPSAEEFAERIKNTLKNYPYLVTVDGDDKITGYAYASRFHTREAFRYGAELSIYIDMDCRRSGAGRMLYEKLEAILKQQNILTLYACIAAADRENDMYVTEDSIRFHEKMGFEFETRHHNCGYKFGRWYDIIWMKKSIGEQSAAPLPFLLFTEDMMRA